MKSSILVGVIALALWQPSAGQEKLLDQLLRFPGSYSQVCDAMSTTTEVPYQAFIITDFAGAGFSKTRLAKIASQRQPLVKTIRSRLLALDFSKKIEPPVEDPAPEENLDGEAFGCDPASLNPLLLRLIRQLHAIETLPELLVVEQRLVKAIAKAKNDSKAPPPRVCGWFVHEEGTGGEDEPEARRDRKIELFNARVAQRDLIMLMAVLMREKSFPAYLETSLEAAYAKGLKIQSKQGELAKIKPGEPIPEELAHLEIEIDAVTRLPRAAYSPVEIPYTRESRDQVRAAAAKWIAQQP